MKKIITLALSATLMLSGCGTGSENTAAGGLLGAQLGSIVGSAIGGISGGPRGSDIGTLVGMAGGAAVGATIGNAADRANQQQRTEYQTRRSEGRSRVQKSQDVDYRQPEPYAQADDNSDDSGFDPTNGGDDVIDFNSSDSKMHSAELMAEEAGLPALSIRNVRYVGDGLTIKSGEQAKVTVEVYNTSTRSLYGVQPVVEETTGNKHIHVSAPIIIEKIAPGKGIRYTAMVKADSKLKDGTAGFRVYAKEKKGGTQSQTEAFNITTKRVK